MIDIEVAGFTGSYASKNASARPYPVGLPEVINKAITVGGYVGGGPYERSMRRAAA